jgi:hypothetical protein
MIALKLRGKITPDGKLEVELPAGVAPEEVLVTVESVSADDAAWEETAWTQEELRELLTPEPKTGKEIAAWLESVETGWENLDMSGEEWVNQQRNKRRARYQW